MVQIAVKSSRADNHVSTKGVSSVSENVSAYIIRDSRARKTRGIHVVPQSGNDSNKLNA
jgi:hypothetical protein